MSAAGSRVLLAPDPGVQDSGVHIPCRDPRGSVLFHVPKQEAEPEEVSWGFGPEVKLQSLHASPTVGKTPQPGTNLQDKYQQRVHVPNVTSLRIENLIPEDSGQYRARASFIGGIEFTQVFASLSVVATPPHHGFPPSFELGVSGRPQFQDPFQTSQRSDYFLPELDEVDLLQMVRG